MQAVKVNSEESSGNELTRRVTGSIEGTKEFLHDVRVEMKQVTWPSREDVVATTWVVIATVAFFGAFLAVVDKLVQLGVAYVFKKFVSMMSPTQLYALIFAQREGSLYGQTELVPVV